jgi:hypothetical protein
VDFVEIGRQMPGIEVAGDICLRRPRPTQGCRADDDDDEEEEEEEIRFSGCTGGSHFFLLNEK